MLNQSYYLDQVQAAVEQYPDWDVDEILRWTFQHWTRLDPEEFIEGVKRDILIAERNADGKHPIG